MATFAHGKSARVLLGRYDMSPFLTEFSIDASIDAPDVTALGSSHKAYLAGGLGDVTASMSGLYSFGTKWLT